MSAAAPEGVSPEVGQNSTVTQTSARTSCHTSWSWRRAVQRLGDARAVPAPESRQGDQMKHRAARRRKVRSRRPCSPVASQSSAARARTCVGEHPAVVPIHLPLLGDVSRQTPIPPRLRGLRSFSGRATAGRTSDGGSRPSPARRGVLPRRSGLQRPGSSWSRMSPVSCA